MVFWTRLEPWWKENEVISRFQGASRKGQLCVHTSLLLQETIYRAPWIQEIRSLYLILMCPRHLILSGSMASFINYEIRIRGKLQRIVYCTYLDFQCRVRVASSLSDWFPMSCGIHQGGFLSLTRYTAFINSLLVDLESSKLCYTISNTPSSPTGYADDLATAATSKHRTDRLHTVVSEYGKSGDLSLMLQNRQLWSLTRIKSPI